MDGTNANINKGKVEEEREGESSTKKLKVTMGVETLDCPICYEPLRPPIFQCSVGHCICSSCREKLNKKCPVCSIKTSFKRCFGMEHVVQEAKVACFNDKYGCAEKVIYYQKEEHKKVCPNAPCFCVVSGCGFAGSTKVLLDHFITQHNCPSTLLPDSGTVSLHQQPGLHVLQCNGASYFFLLSMASEPFGHAISVMCVQPNIMELKFECNMEYDCIATGCCESTNCDIRSSSLSDGPPTVYDLIIPKGKCSEDQNGIMLRATILRRSCLLGKELTPDLQGMPCTKTAIPAAVTAAPADDTSGSSSSYSLPSSYMMFLSSSSSSEGGGGVGGGRRGRRRGRGQGWGRGQGRRR